MYTYGLIWRNSFDEIAKWTSTPSPGKISYYAWDGQNIEMPDNGTAGVARGGQPYTGTRPSGKIIIEDGKGTKFNFNTKTWPGGSFARYRLDEIVWADGYKITVSRSSTDNRINVLSDNRGQRAEFIWGPVVANSTVSFLQEIRIDSAYNGSVLNPQIKVVYSYTANASFPDFPLLTQVLTRDGTQTSGGKILVAYAYGSDAEKLPPNLISKSDDRQNTGLTTPYATFTYEAGSPRVLSSTHAGNVERFDFTYGAFGATSIDATNARGLKTTYSFSQVDGIYRLSQVQGAATVNCLGTATSASYTPNAANPSAPPGYIYERTEKNGSKTRFIRDSRGLVLTRTENATGASPRVTTYTWHATLRLPLTRTTSQAAETFTYSSTGQLLTYSKIDKLAGSPTFDQVRTWTYAYTTLASGFKVLTSVDGPGLTGDGITDVTSFTYSASGALASVTDALGLVTTVQAVNQQGQPTQVLAADGVTWAFTYDLFGRLLTSTVYAGSAGAKTSTYAYDSIGQLVSLTNSLAKIWTFEYNDARQMTKATSPSGDVARYSYDTLGNVTLTEYGTGAPTTAFYEDTQFDELGRLLKTLGAQGQVFQFSHDVEDNLSTVTDSLNYVETNGYDPLNRLIQVIDREGFTTAITSNDSDLMTQYTDPRSIQTQFTYNGFGEAITEVSTDRGTIFYTYDRRGLVKTMTDARGIVTTYSYDNADNLTLIDYPTGVTPDIALAYGTTNGSNTAGKLRSVTQGTALTDTITYPFNTSAGTSRVVEVLGYPGARSYTVDTTFDAEGNIKVIDYPSGDRIDFLYDDDNRVTRVRLRPSGSSTWENLVTSVNYLPNGPVADLTFGDLYNHFRSYDSSYRLTRLRDTKSGSPTLRDVSMGYSLVDNLTSITDAQNAANNETFGYTPREHLSTATGPYGAICYTYDGVGNRTTGKLKPGSADCAAGAGLQTDAYTYPTSSNRLTSVALGAGGSRAFTYDASGNVTFDNRTGGNYGYTYDAAGRMVSFSIGGVLQAEYIYNHHGQQAVRKLYGTSPVTIHSVFGPDGNRIAEYDEATGALIREYIWLDGVPIAVREGGMNYFVRVDHIGRPVFATNAAGTKVWTAAYLPFGGVRTSTGTPIALRFPGQWFQSENGLHQNWMRDYDPTLGRYLQADPLGLVDGASVYGYARQSPNMYSDPTGEFVPVIIGFVLGLILERALEIALDQCGCNGGDGLLPNVPTWTIYGTAVGAFGGFEGKPRTGIGGGGHSGGRTSVWSKAFGSSHVNAGGAAARSAGRRAAHALPYAWVPFALYDAARLWECFGAGSGGAAGE